MNYIAGVFPVCNTLWASFYYGNLHIIILPNERVILSQ